MKAINILFRTYIFSLLSCILLLTACGGEEYKSNPLESEWIERQCLDSNKNNRCEASELNEFAANKAESNQKKTVATKNTYLATQLLETVNSLTGEQRLVLKAPATSTEIDALTTLLWHEIHHNPIVKNISEAKFYLSQKLGIIWPQSDQTPSSYQQQESIVRQHLTQAQQNSASDIAITATIEAMLLNRSIDTSADFSLINQEHSPLALLGSIKSQDDILEWNFSANRQEIALAQSNKKISRISLSNTGQLLLIQELHISPGSEAVPTADANNGKSLRPLASANLTSKVSNALDAFASATTPAPAPAPAPPTNPDGENPSTEARSLIPSGEIRRLQLADDNRTGIMLTQDANQQSTAVRACNQNVITHGIFKFDYYLTNNNQTPVIGACSQLNLTEIEISQDGRLILAWDQISRRLYLVDSVTMREASTFYLQLNSALLTMRIHPDADYAFITEEQGRRSYIVRLIDMQVMTDFSFAGNQVNDAQWLEQGNKLIVATTDEWQLWDTRLIYKPQLLNSGEILGSGSLVFNEDASLYARLKDKKLSLYRHHDNHLMSQYNQVDAIQWNGNQVIIQQENNLKSLALQLSATHPIQFVNAALTASFIAENNNSLSQVDSTLNLPNIATELTQSDFRGLEELHIAWSVSPELENSIKYSGSEQGSITQATTPKTGVITATINSYFRGEAIRWTRDFNITIKAK